LVPAVVVPQVAATVVSTSSLLDLEAAMEALHQRQEVEIGGDLSETTIIRKHYRLKQDFYLSRLGFRHPVCIK
jgi:hypothetical protein